MDASFADYTVTKLDADRFAKQPMRTYGKRAAAKLRVYGRRKDDTSDDHDSSAAPPPAPSTTVSSSAPHVVSSTATSGREEDEEGPPAKKLKSSQSRSSILSYYKPVPTTQPSIVQEETTVTGSTDESVSCREVSQAATKRRRILKIRPTDPPSPYATRRSAKHITPPPRSPLPENKENTGESDPDGDGRVEGEEATDKPSSAKATAATVQTTLNISSKPSFSECKVCDTVWNPLYPDDEKYHKKRHAAVLRAKKRKASVLD